MRPVLKFALPLIFAVSFGAQAAQNFGPPPGAILDLAGQAVPNAYTNYSVNFTATQASTVITFAFRHDPGYFALDDASVTLFGGGSNLLLNGGFEAGASG